MTNHKTGACKLKAHFNFRTETSNQKIYCWTATVT